MHRAVSVLQVLLTGEFLIHPFGTFRGYGGYFGIYPYRLLAADCSDENLGRCVIELLEQSKATGYQIKEIEKYRMDQNDPTSDQLREQFFGSGLRVPSGKFRHIDVSQRHGSKSITVSLLGESKQLGIQQPLAKLRLPDSMGAAAIGNALRNIAAATAD